MSKTIDDTFCNERHKSVDRELGTLKGEQGVMWKKINSQDTRLWLLLAGVLGTLISIWVK